MTWLFLFAAAATLAPPRTAKKPVAAVYHGVKVLDDNRWLEDEKDPHVQAWSDAQNATARSFLDRVPQREVLRKRIDTLIRSSSEGYFSVVERKGRLFATPILLRTSASSGHGVGSALDEIIAERVDLYGFLFAVLGVDCCVEVKNMSR